MKKLITVIALCASQMVYSASDPKDDLIGGKFHCGGRILLAPITFLSDAKYTAEGAVFMNGAYDYDGKLLVLHDVNLRGEDYTMSFNAKYLPNKKKLMLEDTDGVMRMKICKEY